MKLHLVLERLLDISVCPEVTAPEGSSARPGTSQTWCEQVCQQWQMTK